MSVLTNKNVSNEDHMQFHFVLELKLGPEWKKINNWQWLSKLSKVPLSPDTQCTRDPWANKFHGNTETFPMPQWATECLLYVHLKLDARNPSGWLLSTSVSLDLKRIQSIRSLWFNSIGDGRRKKTAGALSPEPKWPPAEFDRDLCSPEFFSIL